MVEQAKHRGLNAHGVKNSADMWRTFGGEFYPHWAICPKPELIKALRAAGVRCRRVGEELFVHEADQSLASGVEAAIAKAEGRQ